MRKLLLPLAALFCVAVAPAAEGDIPVWAKGITQEWTLDDVKRAELLKFSDPSVWKFVPGDGGKGYLELAYDRKEFKSTYTPKHRSPIHIALLQLRPKADFVMDVELMSTTEVYGHQDLCLFFGFESPEKFYYVHLAPAPDANAHNVFIVNEAPRKNLLEPQKKGIEWKKDTWHTVRLVRQGSTGLIEVYFDDMKKPVLKAEDKTFPTGFAGFGSFDDTGRFRKVTLYNSDNVIRVQPADFFKPLGK
jgi:hypothetical protein